MWSTKCPAESLRVLVHAGRVAVARDVSPVGAPALLLPLLLALGLRPAKAPAGPRRAVPRCAAHIAPPRAEALLVLAVFLAVIVPVLALALVLALGMPCPVQTHLVAKVPCPARHPAAKGAAAATAPAREACLHPLRRGAGHSALHVARAHVRPHAGLGLGQGRHGVGEDLQGLAEVLPAAAGAACQGPVVGGVGEAAFRGRVLFGVPVVV